MVIWKYVVQERENPSEAIIMTVPKHTRFLTAQVHNGAVCVWAMVDPNQPPVERRVFFFPTGENIPDGAEQYLGSVQLYNGRIVGHVFCDLIMIDGTCDPVSR